MKVSFAQQRHIEKWMRFLLLKSFRFAVLGAQNETYLHLKQNSFQKNKCFEPQLPKSAELCFFLKVSLRSVKVPRTFSVLNHQVNK
jgi:hypothetical protein